MNRTTYNEKADKEKKQKQRGWGGQAHRKKKGTMYNNENKKTLNKEERKRSKTQERCKKDICMFNKYIQGKTDKMKGRRKRWKIWGEKKKSSRTREIMLSIMTEIRSAPLESWQAMVEPLFWPEGEAVWRHPSHPLYEGIPGHHWCSGAGKKKWRGDVVNWEKEWIPNQGNLSPIKYSTLA